MHSMKQRLRDESGHVSMSVLWIIILGIMAAGFAALSIWAYINYTDQKQNVDSKVTTAVAEAAKAQSDTDEAKFLERDKQPFRQFAGLDDYGHITFDYPKTWSAYQATDVSVGNGATYAVYLHPLLIPPAPNSPLADLNTVPKTSTPTTVVVSRFALRVVVEQKAYDQTLKQYDEFIKNGQLKSSAFSNDNKINGTRIDGSFNKDIRGSAIVVKIRDRTLTIRSDSDAFKEDFERAIKTLNFNQ